MIRRCDGNDPNLLRPVDAEGNDKPADWYPERRQQYRPCDCGKVFDDVDTWVIYPHHRF